jgi:CRP-like cAMP-binding protein
LAKLMTATTPDTKILARSPWFARQSADLRTALMKRARITALDRGQWIYGTGDALNGLYGVLSGSVHLLMTLGEGDTRLIDIVQAGQFFGQPARFGGGPRLVTAIAGEPSTLLHVPDHALAEIARSEPDVWRNFTTLLYQQLSGALHLAAATIHFPPKKRVAARLAMLAFSSARASPPPRAGEVARAKRVTKGGIPRAIAQTTLSSPASARLSVREGRGPGSSKENGEFEIKTPIPLRVTQSQLAELTGLSRKTVNFHLSSLARAGIITLGYRHIAVTNLQSLRTRAGLA